MGHQFSFSPKEPRRTDGIIGNFKKGAFKMALDLDLPILPVTIIGTKEILPNNRHGRSTVFAPGHNEK